MFEKNMKLAYLLDFYIDVLDGHAQDIMRAYYEDDLSLAEIAAGVGISRQGIRHIIKKSEEEILFLEEKLGLMKRQEEIDSALEIANGLITGDKLTQEAKDDVTRIVKILEKGV
ncbi:MAG: DNA-binding protein [Clostridia bacterium]|nr:DNA-binding protein [Clostridia bacterium]